MKKLSLLAIFLLVSCSGGNEIINNFDLSNMQVKTKTKYFNESINFIVEIQLNKPCKIENDVYWRLRYLDKDGFYLAERKLFIEDFYSAGDDCSRAVQDSIRLDEASYKKITQIHFSEWEKR